MERKVSSLNQCVTNVIGHKVSDKSATMILKFHCENTAKYNSRLQAFAKC